MGNGSVYVKDRNGGGRKGKPLESGLIVLILTFNFTIIKKGGCLVLQ